MGESTTTSLNKVRRGDPVTVRSYPEIAATLDRSGRLEGLPFLPEMVKYCDRTLTVRWRANKLLQGDSKGGLRQVKNVVLLDDVTCDGEAHGDCQRGCFLLWKIAWITLGPGGTLIGDEGRAPHSNEGIRREPPLLPRDNICQATELTASTTPLRLLDPRRYYWDITSRIYKPRDYLRYLLGGLYRKTLKRLFQLWHRDKDRRSDVASSDRLGLQRRDLVEVKSAEEIRSTLGPNGRTGGLYFMPAMWGYCGRQIRVLRPVYRMRSERTGEMRMLKQTVTLEGVTCNGKSHGGCQRGCYLFWKEAWLRRVPEDLHRPAPFSSQASDSPPRIRGSGPKRPA